MGVDVGGVDVGGVDVGVSVGWVWVVWGDTIIAARNGNNRLKIMRRSCA